MSNALARNTDPFTSHEAAESIMPSVRKQRDMMLMVFERFPNGLSAEEAWHYGFKQLGYRVASNSYWKRVSDLLNAGYLSVVPNKTTVNYSGRRARIYTITAEGSAYLWDNNLLD